MKDLITYIYEELDDNIFYLIDKWFGRNDQERQEFIDIINKCKNDKVIDIEKLKEYIKNTKLEHQLEKFVDFIDNDIEPLPDKNYYNKLKSIIEIIIANKSKRNKYNR